jgi:hypothetical protein
MSLDLDIEGDDFLSFLVSGSLILQSVTLRKLRLVPLWSRTNTVWMTKSKACIKSDHCRSQKFCRLHVLYQTAR